MTPSTASEIVRTYHRRTKHRFEAYAHGPEALDWDAQPAPFRHFAGAPATQLPDFSQSLHDSDLHATLIRPFATLTSPVSHLPLTLASLGALLHLALGITAWKSYGPDRWAVRANPSSGNLHPIEAYVIIRNLKGLADGVYHYRPEDHALERRGDIAFAPSNTPTLQIALSSAMWREAWKYGERAFRYCQLDTGHAVGALAYAAAVAGWSLIEERAIDTVSLARLLGLDREADFPARRYQETECEEAELLLSIDLHGAPTTSSHPPVASAWHGTASTIDAYPMYRWPVIEEVAVASRHQANTSLATCALSADKPATSVSNASTSVADIILGRRSAQRFDARHVMPLQDFFALLDATLPTKQVPWNALSSPPYIGLLLFVHRVEGLQPGLYLLPRNKRISALLNTQLDARFLRQPVASAPSHLGLQLLTPAPPAELHRTARSLHCHQDIAANACFAVGMLAEYDAAISADSSAYRDLHREAGLIGQVLYLQAEAIGLRGTGIGCFFDDPIHELLGLADETLQTVYHFTVGLALKDTRIETIATTIPSST